ncbi:unnamed protein product, partial [Rotaria magnacalcarata]
MHPKTKQWYMLDYILVNRRFRNSIQDVSAHRGATGGIGTDHHLLMVKVRIHLKCRKKTTETGRLKLDYEKLNNEKLVAEFQTELLKHRNNTQENNRDLSVNEKFTQFADYIHEHSKEYFIKDQKYQKNTKEWFTHEIADIVDKKAKAYLQWQHHRVKDHDPATAFQTIRRLRGSGMNTEHIAIHDKDGNTLTNSEDRLNRWREYFDEILN